MTLIDRLKQYNAWRRGEDESLEQPHPKQVGKDIDEAIARIAELERGLKLALVYMDDDIQMLFDMDRHELATNIESVNQQAYEFDRLAKLIGFKSKYHPRMNTQTKETL